MQKGGVTTHSRKRHEPTDEKRKLVKALAAYGIPHPQIGKLVGCNDDTLEKHYREELDIGLAEANAKVAQSLFKKATGDGPQSVTAAIFWLKVRARWKDTSTVELSGPDGKPIAIQDGERRALLAKLKAALDRKAD